ncbi:MAG: M20/M25/M40 family metallo-hydrolase, partial [Anaerolineales bacterium]|nr:M20/M25/M40 family metallo-hydrolase [Anaerolineales bacterium]
PNVIGILRGGGSGRSLLINGHMDTVGVDGMADPFSGEIRDGKLYGRGAQDMKASLAAMLGAAKALVDNNNRPAGDLILAFVVDEEMLSIGTADLVKHVRADAAIVTEPTDLTICRAHRGFIWYEIETVGRAAHGSRYLEGIDANMHMGRFLADLDRLEKELRQRPPHPLAGPPSLHASKIQGGSEISVYAANCLLQIERRTIPGETVPQATAELQAIIDRLAAEDPTFKATLKATFDRDPFEISSNAPVVQSLERVTSTHLGHAPQHSGQTFWTDAALLAGAGIDTVLIGPIGAGLHSAEEWVDLQSVYALTAILADTAVDFCN